MSLNGGAYGNQGSTLSGGDNWSFYPAQQDVDMAGFGLLNVSGISTSSDVNFSTIHATDIYCVNLASTGEITGTAVDVSTLVVNSDLDVGGFATLGVGLDDSNGVIPLIVQNSATNRSSLNNPVSIYGKATYTNFYSSANRPHNVGYIQWRDLDGDNNRVDGVCALATSFGPGATDNDLQLVEKIVFDATDVYLVGSVVLPTDGNIEISNGNLQIASGDIVATSGQCSVGTLDVFGDATVHSGSLTCTDGDCRLGGLSALTLIDAGTWTPTVLFANASTGVTYSAQYGYYRKVGDLCFITGRVTLSNKGSSTGNAMIGGLPFSLNGGVAEHNISIVTNAVTYAVGATVSSGQIEVLGGTDTRITLFCTGPSASSIYTELTNSEFTNISSVYISGCYICA